MVDGVLGQARAGAERVLLVTGEPGVGKSALLEYAVESASAAGFQVVRAAGWSRRWSWRSRPAEAVRAAAGRLGAAARSAAGGDRAAFGVSAGVPPDPFFVGLGVGLLSAAAAVRLLLCGR